MDFEEEEIEVEGGTRKIVMITVILILLIFTLAAYAVGVVYFSAHFLPGTKVNGFNCSYKTEAECRNLIADSTDAYSLSIHTRNNGLEVLTAEEIGLAYHGGDLLKKLIRGQGRFKWFLCFSQQAEYDVSSEIYYNEEAFDEAVAGLDCMQLQDMTVPANAYIKDDGESFRIVKEIEGNQPDAEKLKGLLKAAVTTGRTTVDLEAEKIYVKPQVYAEDEKLVKNCEIMNWITDVMITYDFEDRIETVGRDTIIDWLMYGEDGYVTLDTGKIRTYVAELAASYDTVGIERSFSDYLGNTVSVSGGTYGWKIDVEKEIEGLTDMLLSGTTDVRKPIYQQEAKSRKINDIGFTYVEVDLTRQYMVVYIDGIPVTETPVITGNPGLDKATQEGVYFVTDMSAPGVSLSEGMNVSYLVQYSPTGGICDAGWMNEFGGTIYLTNGSYGSVFLPPNRMTDAYRNISIGMPVVIHY